MTDAARESRASLTKAVFKECAPESDPAVLQQQEENAQAAVSDLLTQAVEPQRQSQSSVAGIPVEEAEAELARAGAEEAADELRRDTVRLMEVIEKRASGSVRPGEDQDLDAVADRIIAFLSGSGGKVQTQGAGGSTASGDVPGLYMAALMQRVVPQLKAMEESEARLSASGSRRSSRKSLTDEARASLTRLSKAVFSGLAKEGGDAAALAEQQSDVVNFVDFR